MTEELEPIPVDPDVLAWEAANLPQPEPEPDDKPEEPASDD
jgi:hypothetical protein